MEQPAPSSTKLQPPSDSFIDNQLIFFTGKLGGRQIACNGHFYIYDRTLARTGADWWYCACKLKKNIKCKARLQTLGTEILQLQQGLHNHSADIAACKAAALLSTIKADAINSDNPLSVVRRGVASAPDDVFVKLPILAR